MGGKGGKVSLPVMPFSGSPLRPGNVYPGLIRSTLPCHGLSQGCISPWHSPESSPDLATLPLTSEDRVNCSNSVCCNIGRDRNRSYERYHFLSFFFLMERIRKDCNNYGYYMKISNYINYGEATYFILIRVEKSNRKLIF